MAEGTKCELDPPEVSFSPEAEKLFWQFADETEEAMGPGGEFEMIQPLANKLPEHAARLAATIAAYRNLHFQKLEDEDFKRGIQIACFYASEAKRIGASSWGNPTLQLAQKLLKWLQQSWRKPEITARQIYTRGPNSIRAKDTAVALINVLVDHGWLIKVQTKKGEHEKRYAIVGQDGKA